MSKHVMIDLETLGTTPGSVILSIGAVYFNFDKEEDLTNTFYHTVDIQSCLNLGLTVDGSTIKWWFEQSDAARKALFSQVPEAIDIVLGKFAAWLKGHDYIWSHGSTFDITMLDAAYRKVFGASYFIPWHWRKVRDTRTLLWLVPGDVRHLKFKRADISAVKHNALDDAVSQAMWIRDAFQIIRKGKVDKSEESGV